VPDYLPNSLYTFMESFKEWFGKRKKTSNPIDDIDNLHKKSMDAMERLKKIKYTPPTVGSSNANSDELPPHILARLKELGESFVLESSGAGVLKERIMNIKQNLEKARDEIKKLKSEYESTRGQIKNIVKGQIERAITDIDHLYRQVQLLGSKYQLDISRFFQPSEFLMRSF